jgi:hypothetical protein
MAGNQEAASEAMQTDTVTLPFVAASVIDSQA